MRQEDKWSNSQYIKHSTLTFNQLPNGNKWLEADYFIVRSNLEGKVHQLWFTTVQAVQKWNWEDGGWIETEFRNFEWQSNETNYRRFVEVDEYKWKLVWWFTW